MTKGQFYDQVEDHKLRFFKSGQIGRPVRCNRKYCQDQRSMNRTHTRSL